MASDRDIAYAVVAQVERAKQAKPEPCQPVTVITRPMWNAVCRALVPDPEARKAMQAATASASLMGCPVIVTESSHLWSMSRCLP